MENESDQQQLRASPYQHEDETPELPRFFDLNGLIPPASGSLTHHKYLRKTPAPPGVAQ